jgi:hypothetical protein
MADSVSSCRVSIIVLKKCGLLSRIWRAVVQELMRGARSLSDEVRSGQEKQQDAVVGAIGWWWSNAGVGGVCGFRHGCWVVDQVIDGVVESGSGLSLKRQTQALRGWWW